ncbi:heterokaryon incompatibility protein-domain-containing protein [Halenospora varia]|nr:heterokaryon incompatibility protein-domain-containing protein [Halenospora varia]
MPQSQQSQSLCELCTTILDRRFSAGEVSDSSLPVHISHVTGTTARPDLDFIRQSALAGCRLCSEMLRVHSTKVCNGYDGTTRESDAEEALEAVSSKFPRISINAVFEEGDEETRFPHYLLIYTHTIVEDEDEGETEDESDSLGLKSRDAITASGFGRFQDKEPELDTDTFLQTLFEILRSEYLPQSLFPEMITKYGSHTTFSDSSWTQCTSWLDHCTTSHDSCNRQLFPAKSLPKRLIDVGDENHPPFLCLSEKLLPSTEYVTLSHCWGHSKVITLTSSTNPIFSKSIPILDLSQTFQDAIIVTRRLSSKYGIKHLWVDSLCILQDSKEEWLEEAPRMAAVYGNCWCNLAATGGGGLSTRPAGMFSRRNPEFIKPIQISMPASENIEYTIVDAERWTDFVKNSPLNRRAWVCQERLLSPRILHFSIDEIFWECSSGRASETFPRGEPAVDMTDSGANETLVRAQTEVSDDKNTLNSWLDVVETFARCNLTYTSDKLFAIAGLAQHFQSKFGGVDYMAGLWRMGLERQLLWRVEGLGVTKRSKIYRAPSWCWSSIDGPIWSNWAQEDSEILMEVLGANVALEGTDPFGNVSSGLLRLRGRILKGEVASDVHYFPGLRLLLDESLDGIAYHPDEDLESESSNETELFCMPVSITHMENGSDTDDREGIEDEIEVRRDIIDDKEVEVRTFLQGLVLRPSHATHGQYRRIGTFMTVVPNEIETIMQRKLPHLAETEYEAFNGHDQYTVSIV